jgi:hypothetical protein
VTSAGKDACHRCRVLRRHEAMADVSTGVVSVYSPVPSGAGRSPVRGFKEMSGAPKSRSIRMAKTNVGSPNGREPHGDGGPVVVAGVTTCQGGR